MNNNNINRVLEITNNFLQIPSVVGNEIGFLIYMNNLAKNLGYNTILKDNYLKITNKKNENKKNVLFSIHIDRQGLVLTDDGKIEYATNYIKRKKNLKFRREEQEENEDKLKYLLEKCLIENENKKEKWGVFLDDMFLRFKSNLIGGNISFFRQDGPIDTEKIALRYVKEQVIGYKTRNISENKIGEMGVEFGDEFKIERYDLDWKNHKIMFKFDKKIKNKEKNKFFMLKSKISIFDGIYKNFGKMFSGQIDNVISASVLFYLLEKSDFKADILFTCGEEIGESYKSIIEYYNDFNLYNSNLKLVVLDTSPYPDFIGKKDGFLVLRHGDERSGFNEELVYKIKDYLKENKISFDFKPSFLGRTELGKVSIETGSRINGVTLQLPSLNYHTTYETSSIKCLENYIKTINEISLNKL